MATVRRLNSGSWDAAQMSTAVHKLQRRWGGGGGGGGQSCGVVHAHASARVAVGERAASASASRRGSGSDKRLKTGTVLDRELRRDEKYAHAGTLRPHLGE